MPKRPPADERNVNQVLREAERIAAKDRSSLSGDIIQFPASVQHALEAISHFEVTTRDIEEPSNVARGKRLADHLLAKVVDSAWQGARGNKGTEVLGCFIMALRGHMNDVQHILDIALKRAAAEFKFDVDDETGYPKCPHCGDVLDTLEADKVTTDEGVTLECEELVDGRFEYSYDSMDDGDMGGEINHEGYACPHCGKELPEVMQMLIDAMSG